MKISTLMAVGFLASVLIMLPDSGQAGLFGPKGEDCVKEVTPATGCSTADGGTATSVNKKLSGSSVIKTCDDVDYKSECSTHKKVIGTKELFYPSTKCEGTPFATYPWEVMACN